MDYLQESRQLRQLRSGSREGLAWFFDHYHRPIYYYALSLFRDAEQASSITSQVFIQLFESREELRYTVQVRHFLYSQLHQRFLAHLTDKLQPVEVEQEFVRQMDGLAGESGEFIGAVFSRLEESIRELPPIERMTIELSQFKEPDMKELAGLLRLSSPMVSVDQLQSLQWLRKKVIDSY